MTLTCEIWTDSVGAPLWTSGGAPPSGYSASSYDYCLDLLSANDNPDHVAVLSTTALIPSAPPSNGSASRAAWLVGTDVSTHVSAGNSTDAAALQVAIWEVLYDTDSDVSGGAANGPVAPLNSEALFFYLGGLYAPAGYSIRPP